LRVGNCTWQSRVDSGMKHSVLVVEDAEDIRHFVVTVLDRSWYLTIS